MTLHRNAFSAALALIAAGVTCSCSQTAANQPNNQADIAEINASVQRAVAAVNAKDINGMMAYYVPDESLVVFDAVPPRQYLGAAAYRKDLEGFLAGYPGTLQANVSDWKIETSGNLAYGHGFYRYNGPGKDGKPLDLTMRVTDVYKKINGKWLVVHEHVSWPVDSDTGKPDLSSKP
jgi:uncharacterized protein (TIGR02246 family)